jgi:hypothetical protein
MKKLVEEIEKLELTENNMSYCRFQNTLGDLRDCAYVLEEFANQTVERALSEEEKAAAVQLIILCKQIAELDPTVVNVEGDV